ncbi:hypothetical protein M2232_002285 [Bradyrhizobium japonicum]|uniref:hypothetical protein n=1 Tax=Bradyrhizobium japonicum TaxID=375 RepID=UPI002225CBD4|nr:hypothetical protein [Bradyrhizobium japonicum]MCW2218753.1 hypothetical protein [Bradyrhizobium japonicum]MCW2343367.1 hypothetical protein [Bradyrhizobium japonicum]
MPTVEYYLKQAKIAAQMALTEPDAEKALAMHIMALNFFDKAHQAPFKIPSPPPEKPTSP